MLIPVSNGELIDKYTILLIKKKLINNQEKLKKVDIELEFLEKHVNFIKKEYNVDILFNKLLNINQELWNIEDSIRLKEKKQEFDKEFIEIARNVYFKNDIRAELKNEINKLTGSDIFEVKSYEKYN